ncbi:DUF3954 domain-containing protein [Metabacillus fastidiosus]|uniref:DUF3954 domain-containing protein n=1 Tax=Metabacillus fastidiosus TaxID=1458 RepID=UPI003D274DAB
MNLNIEKMTAEIDLMKNATYIIKDGKIIEVPMPPEGFGKQIINWQGGKPCTGMLEQILKF